MSAVVGVTASPRGSGTAWRRLPLQRSATTAMSIMPPSHTKSGRMASGPEELRMWRAARQDVMYWTLRRFGTMWAKGPSTSGMSPALRSSPRWLQNVMRSNARVTPIAKTSSRLHAKKYIMFKWSANDGDTLSARVATLDSSSGHSSSGTPARIAERRSRASFLRLWCKFHDAAMRKMGSMALTVSSRLINHGFVSSSTQQS
mmetsp:Transcript_11076/g.27939  ORF Transcript_11076/g.27939 Transcript_11076/m.27939 type:complete len:202 (-) Transcript_11076:237-842(-)